LLGEEELAESKSDLVIVEIRFGRHEQLDTPVRSCLRASTCGGRALLETLRAVERADEFERSDLVHLEVLLDPLGVVLQLPLSVLLATLGEEEIGALGDSCKNGSAASRKEEKEGERTSLELLRPLTRRIRFTDRPIVLRD
jgi:hypothetical protein